MPVQTNGYFEDMNGFDLVIIGDLIDYGFAGDGSPFELEWVGAHFEASNANPSFCMIGGSVGNIGSKASLSSGQTYYTSLFGGGLPDTVLPRATGLIPYDLSAASFTNYLTYSDSAATFTLLKNGFPSGLAVGAGTGETGYFIDNTNTEIFSVGDTCANQIAVADGSGTSVTWANAASLLNAT